MRHKKLLYTIVLASLVSTGCMGNGNGYNQGYQQNSSTQKYPTTTNSMSSSSSVNNQVRDSLDICTKKRDLAKGGFIYSVYQKPEEIRTNLF